MKARLPTVLLASLLLVALPLAGCIGGAPSDDAADPAGASGNADGDGSGAGNATDFDPADLEGLRAPQLDFHDWFTYRVSGDWAYAEGSHTVLAHTADSSGYLMVSDDRDMVAWDLFWDDGFDPILGQLDRELNPATGTVLLDWPLRNNKEWQTTYDGRSFDFVAHAVEAQPTGIGDVPAYHVVGTDQAGWQIIVVYTPVAEGYALFELYPPEAGQPVIKIELTDHGSDYVGPIVLGEASVLHDEEWAGARGPDSRVPFTVSDGATDLTFALFMGSAAGSYASLLDPAGQAAWGPAYTTGPGGIEQVVTIRDPAAGDWTFQLDSLGTDAETAGGYLRVAELTIEELGG